MSHRPYTRRDVLRAFGAGAATVALPGCATFMRRGPGAGQRRPPNIIFIMSDDHCAQAMSCYGSRVNRTPNIDRLADEGMRFDNCFCTNAICAPSRAVILTGKHSHINGVATYAHRFDGAQTTFPKVLQQVGYQTAMVGKWHLKSDPTGFDYWDVLIGQGPYYNPTMICNGERRDHTGYTTDIITDRALAWLESGRDAGRPFMLMCHHKAPHRNWQPGPDHLTLYDDVDIPEPPTLFDDWSGRGRAATQQEMTIARHLTPADLKLKPPADLTAEQRAAWDAAYNPKNEAFEKAQLSGRELVRWKYQRYVKDYLRCVASVDDNIGRLLGSLDRAGLARNTIVVYTSDQGWYLGEHGWYDKRWMYEESLRMPLLVRWPAAVQAGCVNRSLCQNLDFAETFLDVAGARIPGDMQGRSLLPLLRGRAPRDWRSSVYYRYYEQPGYHNVQRHEGVRTERYKLIHFYRLGEWELYDLSKDPDEMRSVYADPAYADEVAQLKAELARLRKRYRVTDAADREYDQLLELRKKKSG
ncbi:MAG: sulfatase-like hydrolase/transferase [Phycisphaerales bacterium]|nr:MAG: sulfatase-like hydrolase/transferase [Phycisphaerales bacterium]